MYSTFFGLQIASRALATQQAALDVTGHNIANANNKSYTRQLPNIQAAIPLTFNATGKPMTIGAGSTMDSVIRARDSYVDRQFRWETSKYEYWAGKEQTLDMVEGLMNEPSEYSFSSDLNQFWNSWSELAKNPQNVGARAVLKERAMTLVDTLHHIDSQITDMQNDLDANVNVMVSQINTIANQITELNTQIKRSEAAMDNPNDLKDQRDALVDQLAKLVPVRVVETKDPAFSDRSVGVFKVIIGNDSDPDVNILIDDQVVRELQNPASTTVDGFNKVVWDDSPDDWVDLGNAMGQLQANIEIRDQYLVNFRGQFDTLAKGIADAVNDIHQTGQGLEAEGTTGIEFFTLIDDTQPFSAANITVNPVIINNLNKIATGTIPLDGEGNHIEDADGNDLIEVGDGSVALAIASLSQGWQGLKNIAPPLSAGSLGDFYGSVISQMGVDIQQSKRMAEGQSVLVNHMNNQREAVSGVSLDEEMANLVRFQKSYSAAARLVTMMDSMLDSLLGMGVTR